MNAENGAKFSALWHGDTSAYGSAVKTDGPSPEITDLRCPLFSDVLVH
jgi:hypothetical protein